MTRQNVVPGSDGPLHSLIPFWDMANHDHGQVWGSVSVPVRNNAFVPGKPEKDSKVPGKYKLWGRIFFLYTTLTFITVSQAL